MGFSLIERYIFRRALVNSVAALAALIGVLWVVRAVQHVDVVLSKGQGIVTYLKITTLGVPTLASAIAPLALLIGLIQTINTLNQDSEMVVIHASGASRVSLMKPFLALSLLTVVVVYTLNLWIGPSAMSTMRSSVTAMRADLVTVIVREGVFRSVGKGLTFHIAERSPGGALKGVFILDDRDEKETFTYLAKEGNITKIDGNSYLVLQDGQIQRLTAQDRSLSVIKFDSYAFNLSSFSGKRGRAVSQLEVPTLELLNPDPKNAYFKQTPGHYRAELHTRLTGGLYPMVAGLVILCFLGDPSSHRQKQTLAIVLTCITVISIRGIGIYGEGQLRSTPAMVLLVWALPLLTIIVTAFLMATDRSAISPKMQARAEAFQHKISDLLEPLRARIFGARAEAEVAQ